MAEKYLVVDVHHHHIPEGIIRKMSKERPPGWKRGTEIESRLRLMDEAGVDMAVIEHAAASLHGLDICREINDGYAKIVHDYPKKFIPCVHIPLEGRLEVLDELERVVNEWGFRCVTLVSSTSKVTIDSEELFPLWEKINRLDVPIFVHPSIRAPLWGGTKYNLSSHVSREYDIAKATVEVMYGVLTKFPDLKFVMPHYGGGMPSLKGRIMAWFEPKDHRIPEDLKGLPKTPRELEKTGLDKAFEKLFGKLYFDTAGFGGWVPIVAAAVKVIRADRLCFGTDYPAEIHEAQDVKAFIDNIKQLGILTEDKRNILGNNVRNLLKLK